MKKFSLFLALLFASVTLVNAEVIVYTEFGTQKYPDNSTLNIKAARSLDVDFYGAKIYIPKGEKVTLKCFLEGKEPIIYVVGNNYNNIEIGTNKIKSNSNTILKIDVNKGTMAATKGEVELIDPSGKSSSLTENSEPIQTTLERDPVFANVKNNDNDVDINSIQATQDIQPILSPSAPR